MDRYWQDYERRRWMRPNAHLWTRPDAHLWLQPNQALWQGAGYIEPKAGFNPDQPRDDHGRWTDGGGDADSSNPVQLAGDIPTGDSPEIPKEPPATTRLRNVIIRSLASRLGPYIWVAAEAGSWIYDHKAEINSFFDAPKSLEELQDAANAGAGL